MKTLYLSLVLVLTLASSFTKKQMNAKLQSPIADSLLSNLKKEKSDTDNLLKRNSKELIVLVKVPGKKNLVKVKNDHWPNEAEYTYNILKDKTGKVIMIAQSPFSESGDWDIEYRHYFDENGNTYAFYTSESIFDDNVKGGIVRETLLKYYNSSNQNISQQKRLLDKDGKPIKRSKPGYEFRHYKYSIYKNLNDCLKGYHIVL